MSVEVNHQFDVLDFQFFCQLHIGSQSDNREALRSLYRSSQSLLAARFVHFAHRVLRERVVRSRLAHKRFIAVRHKAAAESVVAVRGVLSDKGSAVDLDKSACSRRLLHVEHEIFAFILSFACKPAAVYVYDGIRADCHRGVAKSFSVHADVVIAAVNFYIGSVLNAQRLIVSSAAAVYAARLFFRRIDKNNFRFRAFDKNCKARSLVGYGMSVEVYGKRA